MNMRQSLKNCITPVLGSMDSLFLVLMEMMPVVSNAPCILRKKPVLKVRSSIYSHPTREPQYLNLLTRKEGYSIKIGRNMDMTLCLSQNHYPEKYCRKAERGHGVNSIAYHQFGRGLESDIMTHLFIG